MLDISIKPPEFILPDQNDLIVKSFGEVKAADNPVQMVGESE